MSLPRANYDPRRVCVNPCPNLTPGLGKHKRTVGVYLAGALVRSPPIRKWFPNPRLIAFLSLVLTLLVRIGTDLTIIILWNRMCAPRPHSRGYRTDVVCSSPSPTGPSSTPQSSLPMLDLPTTRNRCWCTSRSSTGSQGSALSSECSSSA